MAWLRRDVDNTPEDRFAEEMTELVTALLGVKATKAADFSLEIERVPGEAPVTMHLQNIFAEAKRLSGDLRAARLRTAALAMAPQPRRAAWGEAEAKFMPGVRAASWVAVAGALAIARRPLAPFLSVICAIDFEHAMT